MGDYRFMETSFDRAVDRAIAEVNRPIEEALAKRDRDHAKTIHAICGTAHGRSVYGDPFEDPSTWVDDQGSWYCPGGGASHPNCDVAVCSHIGHRKEGAN